MHGGVQGFCVVGGHSDVLCGDVDGMGGVAVQLRRVVGTRGCHVSGPPHISSHHNTEKIEYVASDSNKLSVCPLLRGSTVSLDL